MLMTPHLDSYSTTDPVDTRNRISCHGINVHGITHAALVKKNDIFRQKGLNHSKMGGRVLMGEISLQNGFPYSHGIFSFVVFFRTV